MVQLPTTCDAPSAGIQNGGHISGLVRKRLYFWLLAGQQHNFNGHVHISEVQQHSVTTLEIVRRECKCQIKDGHHELEVDTTKTFIFACTYDGNDIPTTIPMFSGSSHTERLMRLLSGYV